MDSSYENVIPFPRKFGMSLEKIEERCLAYLRQASNPMVPVQTLLEYCQRDPDCGKLDFKELVDFLRPHELVHVVQQYRRARRGMPVHRRSPDDDPAAGSANGTRSRILLWHPIVVPPAGPGR